MAKVFLLLCIQTLRTPRSTPAAEQNSRTKSSSRFCIFQPTRSAKRNILSFWSWLNLVLNLFLEEDDELLLLLVGPDAAAMTWPWWWWWWWPWSVERARSICGAEG